MSATTKNDVKRHFSTHDRFGRVLYQPVNQVGATGVSGEESPQADVERTDQKLSQRPAPLEDEVEVKAPLTRNNCASMKPNSVFLRTGCILPNQFAPLRQPVDDNWTRVEDLPGHVFNTLIRQAEWRLMRTENFCTRRGFGISRQSATGRALTRALDGVARGVNAAELYSVQVIGYRGLYVAAVTLQPRQIQQ